MSDKKTPSLHDLSLRDKKSYPKRALPSEDEPLLFVGDLGNSQWRGMIHGHYQDEKLLPHSVVHLTHDQFLDIQSRHRGAEPEDTSTFYVKELNKGFVIGSQARRDARARSLKGRAKYEVDHWGAGFIALLLKVYPSGHKNIAVNYAHPSDITQEDTARMKNALRMGKTWTVETLAGETVKYRFVAKTSINEATASFLRFLLTEKQTVRQDLPSSVQPGTQYIVVTVGGLISHVDVVRFTKTGQVIMGGSAIEPIDNGINNVKDQLQKELRKAHVNFQGETVYPLQDAQTIDDSVINAVIRDGILDLYGDGAYVIDMKAHRDNVMRPLTDAIEKVVREQLNNGVGYNGVIIGGGGSAVSFDYIREAVFPMMASVYRTTNVVDRVAFDVLNGASRGWHATPIIEELNRRKGKKQERKEESM